LAVVCGADETEAVQDGVGLVEGAKVTVGPVPMEVVAAEDEPGRKRRRVTFRYGGPDHALKSIAFLDESGKQIAADAGARVRLSTLGWVSHIRTWYVPMGVKKVRVKVVYFGTTETLRVPIDLSIGVGLGAVAGASEQAGEN
jgi:hypothetical protein